MPDMLIFSESAKGRRESIPPASAPSTLWRRWIATPKDGAAERGKAVQRKSTRTEADEDVALCESAVVFHVCDIRRAEGCVISSLYRLDAPLIRQKRLETHGKVESPGQSAESEPYDLLDTFIAIPPECSLCQAI